MGTPPPPNRLRLISLCRNLGRIDEALASLDRAIELKPDFPEAYNNKGMTLLVVSRREDALACFQAAIAANERYVQAYWGASQVLNALSRFEEARALECKGIEVRASVDTHTHPPPFLTHTVSSPPRSAACLYTLHARATHTHTVRHMRTRV
jgi:tetratricopeptide (TPR) repeat protein